MMGRFRRVRRTPAVTAPVSAPDPHSVFLAALPFAVVGGVALVDVLAGPGVGFLPVLSLGPALAAISRPPLPTALIGMLALACGVLLAVYDDLAASQRGIIALSTIAGVTVAGVIASAGRRRRERELADFKAIADTAQQILLRPVPCRIPPVDIAVRYVSAAASARIGGDLYEVISVGGGIRLVVGDVLGKGLPAARTAAVVLGAFRESAYDAMNLLEIAARIEASLQHQEAVEEFVTAVLAQVSADGREVEVLNCGHPPPLLARDGEVTAARSAEAGLPLGLASLIAGTREVSTIPLKHGDRLLFYTDGITEARDRRGAFYPLERSAALLGLPDLGCALDRLIEDVHRHVGHALQDDAAMLLIGRGQPLPRHPPHRARPIGVPSFSRTARIRPAAWASHALKAAHPGITAARLVPIPTGEKARRGRSRALARRFLMRPYADAGAGTQRRHEHVRTSCGREVTVGRLALGDALRPAGRVFVDLGPGPGYDGTGWAGLTVDEARQLARAVLFQAAAAERECG